MNSDLKTDLQGVVLDLSDMLVRTDLTDDQRLCIESAKDDLSDLEEDLPMSWLWAVDVALLVVYLALRWTSNGGPR